MTLRPTRAAQQQTTTTRLPSLNAVIQLSLSICLVSAIDSILLLFNFFPSVLPLLNSYRHVFSSVRAARLSGTRDSVECNTATLCVCGDAVGGPWCHVAHVHESVPQKTVSRAYSSRSAPPTRRAHGRLLCCCLHVVLRQHTIWMERGTSAQLCWVCWPCSDW